MVEFSIILLYFYRRLIQIMKHTLNLIIVLLTIFIVSCSSTPLPANPTKWPGNDGIPENTTGTAYPASMEVSETASNYPAPLLTEETEPTPTIDPALGVVKGQLYLKGEPVAGVVLFLSDIVKDNQGNEKMVSIDYNTKIRAVTQKDGTFTFANVPPNRYALVLISMPNAFILATPGTEESIVVPVTTGMQEDLGRLDYDDLPLQPK